MKEFGSAVTVFKNSNADLVHQMVREVVEDRPKSEVDRHELAERDGKIGELNWKVHLLVDEM